MIGTGRHAVVLNFDQGALAPSAILRYQGSGRRYFLTFASFVRLFLSFVTSARLWACSSRCVPPFASAGYLRLLHGDAENRPRFDNVGRRFGRARSSPRQLRPATSRREARLPPSVGNLFAPRHQRFADRDGKARTYRERRYQNLSEEGRRCPCDSKASVCVPER